MAVQRRICSQSRDDKLGTMEHNHRMDGVFAGSSLIKFSQLWNGVLEGKYLSGQEPRNSRSTIIIGIELE